MIQDTEAPADAGDMPGLAELDALEHQAAALEAGAAAQSAPPPPPATTTAAELRSALELVRMVAAPAFGDWQDFGRVWNDQALEGIAVNGGAIMDRHGWSMGELMSTWGPYIGLVAAVAPPSLVTYQHLQLRKAEAARRAREQQQQREAPSNVTPAAS